MAYRGIHEGFMGSAWAGTEASRLNHRCHGNAGHHRPDLPQGWNPSEQTMTPERGLQRGILAMPNPKKGGIKAQRWGINGGISEMTKFFIQYIQLYIEIVRLTPPPPITLTKLLNL